MPSSVHQIDHEAPHPSDQATAAGRWRVLVAENRKQDAEHLVTGLQRHGHEVSTVGTGAETLRVYDEADLLLLDLELPDLDGLEVCRIIRTQHDIPVIAVTARGSGLDRVLGLRAGADDYLVKPYDFLELMARIDAVMRRARPRPPSTRVIHHGPLRIDADARQVTLHGVAVELTCKEFELLHVLASHPHTVVSRKQLMQAVWHGSWSRRTLDTHVSSLRSKLGGSDWITTVRGVGFRLRLA
ncbi:response regulator transcription factor [Streptomyces sclerotialus]|uniref:response regulator transcription factor n=1 Tax=Streptomyces sclerotialus TaxID=1957 RepID=UPI00069099FD